MFKRIHVKITNKKIIELFKIINYLNKDIIGCGLS